MADILHNDLLTPYLQNKFHTPDDLSDNVYELFAAAAKLAQANTQDKVIEASIELNLLLDKDLVYWRAQFGGDSGFSYLKGIILEAIVMRLATAVTSRFDGKEKLSVVKLSTSEGVVTGLAFQFRRQDIPQELPLFLRRDREDVIIGIRRDIIIKGSDGADALLKDELIPICIIACKIYIDSTRLENVLAKARNFLTSHARCQFIVASEWDALGAKEWHDSHGRLLDSLYAPVEDIVFLRGDGAKRPVNANLTTASLHFPYQRSQMERLGKAMESAIKTWA
jgi:hypothetical protein